METETETKRSAKWLAVIGALLVGSALTAAAPARAAGPVEFDLIRSAAAEKNNCLGDVRGHATITPHGEVEIMDLSVSGLPPNTDFDVFVIQVPNTPFGMAWYQGDVETNGRGRGRVRFVGRFSVETFIVAPGSAPAPVVHDDSPFPDASTNPATNPVHTYHVGVWFNSPDDAAAAGCPGTPTPFNGEHNAGIQVLSTRNFADDAGPLRQVQ